MKPFSPGFCLLGVFVNYCLISLVVMGLFRFSDSSWLSFGRFYVSRNLSILPRLSSLLAYNCVVFSYNHLYFCGVSCYFSFHFWFYLVGPLSCRVWLKVPQSCLSFQTTSFWCHWPFVLLFSLCVIYFHCDLYYFILPSYSGIFLLFSF